MRGDRLLTFFFLLVQIGARAQPSFCFSMAEDRQALRPLQRSVALVQQYKERIPYHGMVGSFLTPEKELPLQGGPLFRDSTKHWIGYSPVVGVAESHVLMISGSDTMRIDLPEDMKPLIDRAWRRGDRDTPEVIRFRKGRFSVEELVADPWSIKAANQLAKELIAEDDAAYKKELADLEEYFRNLPPPVPPSGPYVPPPPMTEEDLAAYWAQQPALQEVRIVDLRADTVELSITGRIMLTGDCASSMPLLGMEMQTDTGWVERFPFDESQMDCGLPWGDWTDHDLVLPLRYWVRVSTRIGENEMAPGMYRLLFQGGNRQRVTTSPFRIM